jgi:phosphoglycolate phosphatase-like HAD superfamily hydrolase
MKAAVLLDVDGTLVDSNDAHARAWLDAFAAHGITVAFEPVRRSIGMGGDKLMPAVSGIEEDSPLGRAIATDRARVFKRRYLPDLRPFADVRPLVERFVADGFVVAVASSAKQDELQPLLEIAGVADLVPRRTSSDDAEESKPDPDIVQAALTQCGCPPSRAVMLGDTPYDVEAAARAEVAIVGVECGGWRRDDLRGAVEVYGAPAQLLARYEESVFARMRNRGTDVEA